MKRILSMVLCLAITFSAALSQAAGYRIVILTPPPDGLSAWPYNINDRSEVSGLLSYPDRTEAFVWLEASGFTGLGDLRGGDFYSVAYAVSSSGLVAGTGATADGTQAFKMDLSKKRLVPLKNPYGAGASSEGRHVNDAGRVVGSCTSDFNTQACFWDQNNNPVLLGDLGPEPYASSAYASNSAGTIVGAALQTTTNVGFIWKSDTGMVPMPNPTQYESCYANMINEPGIAGGTCGLFSSEYVPVMWDSVAGVATELPILAGASLKQGEVQSVNDAGVMVGYSANAAGRWEAVLWDSANGMTPVPLASLVVNPVEGFILAQATSVNNAGWIVGVGDFGNYEAVGYVLVPMP